jgi:hypothetical protein
MTVGGMRRVSIVVLIRMPPTVIITLARVCLYPERFDME